jgi:hypothetical protein
MSKLKWDQVGERVYETGVDHGVLYLSDNNGVYDTGYAWNGLTTVTESPSGAESNKQYADNRVYLNLLSAEEFSATVEAFTYPDEFAQCDGSAVVSGGVSIGQQTRRSFGLSYRTLIGDDVVGTDLGYKLHLVYGAVAAPSEKAHGTVNDSPEAMAFSWDVSTTPVDVDGTNPVTGRPFKPTATLTIDSTKVDAAALATLEDTLYGTVGAEPRLPLPGEVMALFAGTVTEVRPVEPTYDAATDTVTIPTVTGVDYRIDGEIVTGNVVITEDTVVTATPQNGYVFAAVSDNDWYIAYA